VIVAGPALPDDFRAGQVPVAVTLVPDPAPFGGPLVVVANVLSTIEAVPSSIALVVGGDMPRLVPAVLLAMVERLAADPRIDAVLLGSAEGAMTADGSEPPRRQVLPLAVRVQPGSRAAREAVEAGRGSLQALVGVMRAIELPPSRWRPLDPEGWTLTDVDTRADLERLRSS
jgi:molybdopterin-guanine dinucleotide biosynthesis protein A